MKGRTKIVDEQPVCMYIHVCVFMRVRYVYVYVCVGKKIEKIDRGKNSLPKIQFTMSIDVDKSKVNTDKIEIGSNTMLVVAVLPFLIIWYINWTSTKFAATFLDFFGSKFSIKCRERCQKKKQKTQTHQYDSPSKMLQI